MGAQIAGLGTDTIEIIGVDELQAAQYEIIPDRIEAGTLLLAGAITGGCVTVEGVEARASRGRSRGARRQRAPMSTAAAMKSRVRAVGRPRPTDISRTAIPGHSDRFASAVHGVAVVGQRRQPDQRHTSFPTDSCKSPS